VIGSTDRSAERFAGREVIGQALRLAPGRLLLGPLVGPVVDPDPISTWTGWATSVTYLLL